MSLSALGARRKWHLTLRLSWWFTTFGLANFTIVLHWRTWLGPNVTMVWFSVVVIRSGSNIDPNDGFDVIPNWQFGTLLCRFLHINNLYNFVIYKLVSKAPSTSFHILSFEIQYTSTKVFNPSVFISVFTFLFTPGRSVFWHHSGFVETLLFHFYIQTYLSFWQVLKHFISPIKYS